MPAPSHGTTALIISTTSVAVTAYLLLRLRAIERQLAAEREEARAAHLHLTRRVEAAMESRSAAAAASRPNAPILASRALQTGSPAVVAQPSGEGSSRSRAPSACSSSNTDFENEHGYRTADEDADDDDDASSQAPLAAPPALSHPIARSPDRNASGQDEEGGPDSPLRVEKPSAGNNQGEWGTRSIMAEGGSWSCIDGAAPSSGGSGAATTSQPAASADEAKAQAAEEARLAAEGALLAKADELYSRHEYEACCALLAGSEQTIEVQWRRCRVLKELGEAAKQGGDADRCRQLLYEGLEHVSAALNEGAGGKENAYVHKWYAIAVSQTSSYEGTKATITKSLIVKEHFATAADLNPMDATTRHALGMWYWEVASLSWAMRKIAAAVFASPPNATYDEALAHFQLAEGIAPGFYIRNRLMIAKCQLALRDKPNARKWAQLATELPIQNQYDDKKAVDEAKQMLASL